MNVINIFENAMSSGSVMYSVYNWVLREYFNNVNIKYREIYYPITGYNNFEHIKTVTVYFEHVMYNCIFYFYTFEKYYA